MSVDTYLKGKNTSRYLRMSKGEVQILLSPELTAWAESVHITTQSLVLTKRLKVLVEHRHTAACGH